MKYLILLVLAMHACAYLNAQENYIATRLTRDPPQEGFPSGPQMDHI